jgi:GT2 family glycosyltransferase
LIANETNRGFAAAVNQGVRVLSTQFILLLNPDAVIERGVDAMAEACSMPGVAAAGGALTDARGAPQTGFMVRKFPTPSALICETLLLNRLWPRNRVNWQYRCMGLDYSVAQDVEQPAGAFLMLRRDAWEELGGFDEGFHAVWFEDVDFCKRIADAGGRIRYVPDAVAKHTGGHSIWSIGVENRRLYWYGSLLRYSARHFRPWAVRTVCLAVAAGSIARTIGDVALGRSLKPIAGCGRILALAAGHLRGVMPPRVKIG